MIDHEPRTKEDLVKQFREDALTDAARKIIAAEGFAGVTIERVAELAGVSKGTIYLYFKNKDDLLRATVVSTFGQLTATVREATEREAEFYGKLRALVETQLKLFAENQAFFRSLVADHKFQPQPNCDGDEVLARHLEYARFVASVFERGREEGRLREGVDLDELAFFLIHLLHATGFRHLFGLAPGDIGSPVEVDRIVSYLLQGIGRHGD